MPFKKKEVVEKVNNLEVLKEKVKTIRLDIASRLDQAYDELAEEHGLTKDEVRKIHLRLTHRYLV